MEYSLEGVRDLIARVVGEEAAGQISLGWIQADDGHDTFEISGTAGAVVLRGSGPSALAAGFGWYLKYDCGCQVSICGSRVRMPQIVPMPRRRHIRSPYRWHYMLNPCVFGYTMAFWHWPDWEQRLDWMALNGVNACLCLLGQEEVWRRLLLWMGYDRAATEEFLVGPSFMPWQWVNNMSGWGGPLPESWFGPRVALARQVMDRMEALGIAPVLPGYAGMVPESFAALHPRAHVVPQGRWNDLPRPSLLDMKDPLFAPVAQRFYALQEEILGRRSPLYYADLFAEGGREEELDIPGCAGALQRQMLAYDPDAVWLMLAWQGKPRANLLSGVDLERCLIVDLWCECTPTWSQTQGFSGASWLWSTIQNFGGTVGLFGNLRLISQEPPAAAASPLGAGMAGIGHTPEGMEINPVTWELQAEMFWRPRPPELYEWLGDYIYRRYGGRSPHALGAWQMLSDSAYNVWDYQEGGLESILCARPGTGVRSASSWGPDRVNYDPAKVRRAARLLMQCYRHYNDSDPFLYDLVDVTRQALGDLARQVYAAMMAAFGRGDAPAFETLSGRFLTLGEDMEQLLATRPEFLLGARIRDARAWGRTPQEQDLYEFNVRTIITLWADRQGAELLHEYANKEWAGMLGGFYLPRWRRYIAAMGAALAAGEPAPKLNWYDWEYAWTVAHDAYPDRPAGDVGQVVARLQEKYLADDGGSMLSSGQSAQAGKIVAQQGA